MANFYSSGQVCTNGTRVFVQRTILGAFEAAVLERVARIRMGDPLDPDTNFGPLASFAHRDRVLGYLRQGREEGARLLAGGGRATGQAFARGAYVEPTVFTDCSDDMTIVREEIFGPVMSILVFDDEEEVIARANATDFGLFRRCRHRQPRPCASRHPPDPGRHLLAEQLGRVSRADAGRRPQAVRHRPRERAGDAGPLHAHQVRPGRARPVRLGLLKAGSMSATPDYDFIIIGAGSAGAVAWPRA